MKKLYRYRLEKNTCFYFKSSIKIASQILIDERDISWGSIEFLYDDMYIVTIYKHYMWDGCSPKINILDLFTLGIPDGIYDYRISNPKTYYATLIHDFLYQFSKKLRIPRKIADDLFLDEMKKSQFKLASIYYIFVRLFGRFFWNK